MRITDDFPCSFTIATPLLAGLYWLERCFPLRAEVEPKLKRDARNLAIAALSPLTIWLLERPVAMRLAEAADARGWGLLKLAHLPYWIEAFLGLALLDYTLWLWHVLTHKTALLWRFHRVHHADLDLDASTALRFHFGEMALSVPWRAAQIILIGVSPRVLALWQGATLISMLFHHSNVELPEWLETRLGFLIVTPRLHGIHHSAIREQRDSNWSSGLTLWDRLHGTFRNDVAQRDIRIGVPGLKEPAELGLTAMILLPWRNPGAPSETEPQGRA